MPIVGTLPNNIQNGQLEDATPLMANFNFLANQINANGNPSGTLTAPSGTAMSFQQPAAPLGWVAQTGTAFDDAMLHIVIPANFVGTGGTNLASTLITGPFVGGAHALTIAELAAHGHPDSGHAHGTTENPHTHSDGSGIAFGAATGGSPVPGAAGSTGSAVTGLTINLGFAQPTAAGSGTAHSHTTNAALKFVDHIVAVKS